MSEGFAYLLVSACLLLAAGCSDATKMCKKHTDVAACLQDVQCDWNTDTIVCNAKP